MPFYFAMISRILFNPNMVSVLALIWYVIFVVYIYSVKKNNYEELIVGMIKRGIVLDHSKSPCEENFIPDKKVTIIMFGLVGHEQNILPQCAESL